MAEAEKKKDGEGEDAPAATPKKSKRKLMLFAAIGVVVLAIAGAGAFFMMKKKSGAEEAEGAAAAEAAAEEKHKNNDLPPVYLKLDAFTTNLAMESGDQPSPIAGQYIQVVVEMKVEDVKAEEELKQYMPEIRNNILRLLSSKAPSKLASTEGKDLLAREIRDSVNGILNPVRKGAKAPTGPVESVLFSSFIIQ